MLDVEENLISLQTFTINEPMKSDSLLSNTRAKNDFDLNTIKPTLHKPKDIL